jgi:hypothetical protein
MYVIVISTENVYSFLRTKTLAKQIKMIYGMGYVMDVREISVIVRRAEKPNSAYLKLPQVPYQRQFKSKREWEIWFK